MITVSIPSAGNLQTILDTAAALPSDGVVAANANFRCVLEQVRESRESDAKTDDPKSSRDKKQPKDSDSAATLAAPQPVTPPTEAPRLILPFTTSFTLRQDTTAPPDDSAAQDTSVSADDASPAQNPIAQNSMTAAEPKAVASTVQTAAVQSTVPTLAIFRSTLNVPSRPVQRISKTNSAPSEGPASLPLESAPETMSAPSGARQKVFAKLQTKWKDSVSSKTAATPPAPTKQDAPTLTADPPAPALPVTTSTTLDQAAPTVKTSSTVDEAPDTSTTSTSTVDRGPFILADSGADFQIASQTASPIDLRVDSRKAAYQYHSSREAASATSTPSHISPEPQKDSDSTATITAPIPVAETVEPQRLMHTPVALNTPRQNTPVAQNNSTDAQDSITAAPTDSKTAMPPTAVQAEDTTAAPPTGSLAFAARLTPTEEPQAPASTPAPDASRPADSQVRVQTAPQSVTSATTKQIAVEADQPSDAHSGESGSQADRENRFAKPEMALPQTHAPFQAQPAAAPAYHASASPLTPAARMDQVQDPPAPAPSGNHDITIRIADSNTDQGTAVRFVERAGEVHVSVRTGDAEMAQTLRGGLNDLVNRLEDGGIRTQVWQPGANASTSQNDSHHPFADPDGSNGRQYSSGSNSEQESKQHNKPRWVEELEGSIGNTNFKETTQLPWQA